MIVHANQKEDEHRNRINPDVLITGIEFFDDNDKLDVVMEFIAKYVRKVYGDRFLKKTLQAEPGTSFVDIITASDIAYIISLIKNSQKVWTQSKDNSKSLNEDEDVAKKNTKTVRPLFTSGEGKKRTFGETVWSKKGLAYFKSGETAWKSVFNDKVITRRFYEKWEKWINTNGKKIALGSGSKKSLYSVLRTREEGEDAGQAGKSDDEEDEVGTEEFVIDYDSDTCSQPTLGVRGLWSRKEAAAENIGDRAGMTTVTETEKEDDEDGGLGRYEEEDNEEENDEEEKGKGKESDRMDNTSTVGGKNRGSGKESGKKECVTRALDFEDLRKEGEKEDMRRESTRIGRGKKRNHDEDNFETKQPSQKNLNDKVKGKKQKNQTKGN